MNAIPYLFFLKYRCVLEEGRYYPSAFDGEGLEGDGECNTVPFLNFSGFRNNNKGRYRPNAFDGEGQEDDGERNTVSFSKI